MYMYMYTYSYRLWFDQSWLLRSFKHDSHRSKPSIWELMGGAHGCYPSPHGVQRCIGVLVGTFQPCYLYYIYYYYYIYCYYIYYYYIYICKICICTYIYVYVRACIHVCMCVCARASLVIYMLNYHANNTDLFKENAQPALPSDCRAQSFRQQQGFIGFWIILANAKTIQRS